MSAEMFAYEKRVCVSVKVVCQAENKIIKGLF